ncbi:MAG TPA: peptidoglycan bridge formation glycyltransferase FemA/FemB family protein [Candidatus Limnocylindria bacterium]|nr:peptidoglycan bridge formation glycyltransferase FemA/FemB family protein [Candidatus Limnocylindria bacterium]
MHVHGARAPGQARRGRDPAGRAGDRRELTITARPASADEAARWDELVVATGRPHLLQSDGWARLKAASGWRARRFVLGEDGVAQVLLRSLPLGMSVAYAPRGPLVADADLVGAVAALRDALRAERCTSLLCDPEAPAAAVSTDALASARISRSTVHVQPGRTLLMDLTQDPEAMLAAMRKKTRQYIRKGERAGVITEETRDVGRFHRILARVAERDRFGIHDRAYFERVAEAFGERAHFQMARVGDDDVGALLVARMGDRAWELFGGWSGTHAEERPFYLLKWRSMMRMKQLGAVRYDMWGLAEPGDDALAGVENFKLGFGGEVVDWIGALETPVTPGLYPLWLLAGRRRLARSA